MSREEKNYQLSISKIDVKTSLLFII